MNLGRSWDIRSMHKNRLDFYILAMKNEKIKLGKQFHSHWYKNIKLLEKNFNKRNLRFIY